MAAPSRLIDSAIDADTARSLLRASGVASAPVIDAGGTYVGVLESREREPRARHSQAQTAGELAEDSGAPVHPADTLDTALEAITAAPLAWVPVLDEDRR